MALPYKISTLLYCFNEQDEVLLLHRAKEPNLGLWSPCGGKLHTEVGESPYACACREGEEEMGLKLMPRDLHLAGIISEHGYEGQAHWLMFLFEVKRRLTHTPPAHREGQFAFFKREELSKLAVPVTDREQIWPLFWQHRGGFFAAHCRCHPDQSHSWTLEESILLPSPLDMPQSRVIESPVPPHPSPLPEGNGNQIIPPSSGCATFSPGRRKAGEGGPSAASSDYVGLAHPTVSSLPEIK